MTMQPITPETPPDPDAAPETPFARTLRILNEQLEPPALDGGVAAPGDFATDPTLARQASIPISLPRSIAIVGCGGVGSWLAYFLALAGVNHLLLFDSDTVSESNLNRAPYGATVATKGTVDRPKTEVLRDFLLERRPGYKFECYPNLTPAFATALDLHEKVQWLACSTDSLITRQDTARWCRDNEVVYIEAAAEGDYGSMAAAPADFATPAESAPGYQSVPVWVGPCVAAAAMACSHILHGRLPADASARWGWNGSHMEFTSHNETPSARDRLHDRNLARTEAELGAAIRGRGVASPSPSQWLGVAGVVGPNPTIRRRPIPDVEEL